MDKTFDEAIAGIRKAERGVEVREDIAQGMEYVKQCAEEVTGQQQAALQASQIATGAASTATEKATAAAESKSAAQTAATIAAQSAQSASADAKSAESSAALFGGTWEQIASERVLMGALSSHKASMAYSIALSSMGYLNGNPIPTKS